MENSILSAEDLANTLKQLTLDLTKLYYDGIAKKNNYAAIKDFLEKDQYKEKLTKKVENFLLDLEKASIPDTAVDLFDRSVISCHLIRAWLDFFTCISNADKSHSLDSHFRNSAAQYALSKLPPDLLGYMLALIPPSVVVASKIALPDQKNLLATIWEKIHTPAIGDYAEVKDAPSNLRPYYALSLICLTLKNLLSESYANDIQKTPEQIVNLCTFLTNSLTILKDNLQSIAWQDYPNYLIILFDGFKQVWESFFKPALASIAENQVKNSLAQGLSLLTTNLIAFLSSVQKYLPETYQHYLSAFKEFQLQISAELLTTVFNWKNDHFNSFLKNITNPTADISQWRTKLQSVNYFHLKQHVEENKEYLLQLFTAIEVNSKLYKRQSPPDLVSIAKSLQSELLYALVQALAGQDARPFFRLVEEELPALQQKFSTPDEQKPFLLEFLFYSTFYFILKRESDHPKSENDFLKHKLWEYLRDPNYPVNIDNYPGINMLTLEASFKVTWALLVCFIQLSQFIKSFCDNNAPITITQDHMDKIYKIESSITYLSNLEFSTSAAFATTSPIVEKIIIAIMANWLVPLSTQLQERSTKTSFDKPFCTAVVTCITNAINVLNKLSQAEATQSFTKYLQNIANDYKNVAQNLDKPKPAAADSVPTTKMIDVEKIYTDLSATPFSELPQHLTKIEPTYKRFANLQMRYIAKFNVLYQFAQLIIQQGKKEDFCSELAAYNTSIESVINGNGHKLPSEKTDAYRKDSYFFAAAAYILQNLPSNTAEKTFLCEALWQNHQALARDPNPTLSSSQYTELKTKNPPSKLFITHWQILSFIMLACKVRTTNEISPAEVTSLVDIIKTLNEKKEVIKIADFAFFQPLINAATTIIECLKKALEQTPTKKNRATLNSLVETLPNLITPAKTLVESLEARTQSKPNSADPLKNLPFSILSGELKLLENTIQETSQALTETQKKSSAKDNNKAKNSKNTSQKKKEKEPKPAEKSKQPDVNPADQKTKVEPSPAVTADIKTVQPEENTNPVAAPADSSTKGKSPLKYPH